MWYTCFTMIDLYETVSLFDDEEIVGFFRSHWVVLVRPLLVPLGGLWLLAFIMFPLISFGLVGVGVLLVGVLLAGLVAWRRMVIWYGTFYILTNRRLFILKRAGFFKKKMHEIALNKVASLSYDTKGVAQTIFRLGTVHLAMRDGQDGGVLLENLARPQVTMDTISRQVHALQTITIPPPPSLV